MQEISGVRIPAAFQQPEWVTENYNKFEDLIREDYKKRKKLDHDLVRKLLVDLILGGVKPIWPLKKKNINKLLDKMYETLDNEEFQYRYYMLYRAGFFLDTFTADSFTPNSLELPKEFRPKKAKIIKEYHQRLDEARTDQDKEKVYIWVDKEFKKLATQVLNYFRERNSPVVNFLDSGSKGSEDDLRKLLVAVGLSINSKGEINDVIDRSGAEGLNPTQFFNYSSQGIVTQYDKSHRTAEPGYLVRQLNTIVAGVQLSKKEDCGSKRYLKLKIIDAKMLEALNGKIRLDGNSLTPINKNDTDLIGETVSVRSPLFCKAEDGICKTCYNPKFVDRMGLEETAGIGTLASTANAELLLNLALKGAHTGLSLNKEEIDFTEDAMKYSN
jgi:DNA-directed RNA polymerase subunit beta'